MDQTINELEVNGIKYIRADGVKQQSAGEDIDGLKYAIVRSRNQGVMAGFVVSISGQTVTLKRARQMWSWKSSFVLTDAAEKGVNDAGCKFSCEASQDTVMLEACGVLYCTDVAMKSIRDVKAQDHG